MLVPHALPVAKIPASFCHLNLFPAPKAAAAPLRERWEFRATDICAGGPFWLGVENNGKSNLIPCRSDQMHIASPACRVFDRKVQVIVKLQYINAFLNRL
jgi:hypothetical protein